VRKVEGIQFNLFLHLSPPTQILTEGSMLEAGARISYYLDEERPYPESLI